MLNFLSLYMGKMMMMFGTWSFCLLWSWHICEYDCQTMIIFPHNFHCVISSWVYYSWIHAFEIKVWLYVTKGICGVLPKVTYLWEKLLNPHLFLSSLLICTTQGFSALTLLTFWTSWFWAVGSSPVCCSVFIVIFSLYPLDVNSNLPLPYGRTIRKVPGYWQSLQGPGEVVLVVKLPPGDKCWSDFMIYTFLSQI